MVNPNHTNDSLGPEGSYYEAQEKAKAQEHERYTPSYSVISETGPDHDKHFTVGIYFGKEKVAEGKGKSKQEAEQEAARKALIERGWND